MESYVTSYCALFDQDPGEALEVERIEIPLIQRDYAQGRKGETVQRIRTNFLSALRDAVCGDDSLSLDFVYGGVDDGVMRPLDGQQRLTTLFLLHWYLGHRAEALDEKPGWKRFSYATRPSARLFCERLVGHSAPLDCDDLSAWIVDQPWYQYTWSHDPTIQGMLVMLDAMHEHFRDVDAENAWRSLTHPDDPAISFHLLPMEGSVLDEDRYIKMNSRGKPLTEFENFKARFEQLIEKSVPGRATEFATKVDGQWADMLWPYHGGDYLVDDEFMRYFHFLTEVREWRDGEFVEGEVSELAARIYGPGNPDADTRLDFLIRAFDTWVDTDIQGVFDELFVTEPDTSNPPARPVIFGTSPNLFQECCRKYGAGKGRSRQFRLPQSIYLYAVLWHRLHDTDDVVRRIRIVRNLVEASGSEIRPERMAAILTDTEKIMSTGSVEGLIGFNQAQVAEEALKVSAVEEVPDVESELFRLEDEPTLRGGLAAFEIDPATLPARREAFHSIMSDPQNWLALSGALLATGDYWQQLNQRFFLFGSPKNETPWRALFSDPSRDQAAHTREVLDDLLIDFAGRPGTVADRLAQISREYVEDAEKQERLDWRVYFVKYPCMRSGDSGRYAGRDGDLGFSVCMLRLTQMNSYYRDPFLLAVYEACERQERLDDPWFMGYEWNERWLRLSKTGIGLRCVDEGFALDVPAAASRTLGWERVSSEFDVDPNENLLRIPQTVDDGVLYDQEDRVVIAAEFVNELIRARL